MAEPIVVFSPRLAQDAEQKRDADGKFGSGGGGGERKILGKTGRTKEEYEEHLRSSGSPETLSRKKSAKDSEAPFPSTMQGEAGRQARQQARDCNTGRFRQ